MASSTPRKDKNRHAAAQGSNPAAQGQYLNQQQYPLHGHGHGHARNRSHQLQAEAHRQHQFPTSDYESDTNQYMASHPSNPPPNLSTRTNTELNMGVLNSYVPSITSILSIAASAVLYTFCPPDEWKRSNMEGTMFICSQGDQQGEVSENGCLFILNRKNLFNLLIEFSNVDNFELAGDLLIFKLREPIRGDGLKIDNGDPVEPDVIGLWTFAEEDADRQTNAALIYEMWSKVREARERKSASLGSPSSPPGDA
ncbi:PH domain-like protein [Xylariaceae sp. FL0255]|nr:PH domain-like protein [Xylariaceae sp. FL0255]